MTNSAGRRGGRLWLCVGLAGVGLWIGACGSEASPRDVLVDDAAESGIDEDLASCLVDGLFDELGAERAEEVVLTEDPGDLSVEDRAILTEVESACASIPTDEAPGVTIEE